MTRAKAPAKKEEEKPEVPSKIANVRRSLDLEKSDDSSLYVSALETLPEENAKRLSRTGKVSYFPNFTIYLQKKMFILGIPLYMLSLLRDRYIRHEAGTSHGADRYKDSNFQK